MQSKGEKECREFINRYWTGDDSQPKYERLRRALSSAIADGFWSPEARLPNEQEWVTATPCGLATVQRTLRSLVAEGLIQRRRGIGTTVVNRDRPMTEPWHMRFMRTEEDTEYLSISTSVLNRRIIKTTGAWSKHLDQGDHPIVKLTRIMHIANEVDVYNVFYARADLFPELTSKPLHSLNGTNIKRFIAARYNISVRNVRHRLRFEPTPKWIAEYADPQHAEASTVLNATAQLPGGEGLYYQDFFIPPNKLLLELGTDFI
ncbi:GntR family transcriptional regulator [Pseudomonas sp. GD03651]|uniref:GntR family transcriptional regulator n=1 Tax=unclassified Pseudomonas TaxID=196821 RepID=UPI00244C820E|nr:GntR family transcriptional regulator [Pseudomonas sp. GD03651]MDH2184755.1 GntR family transcriptional regulator [Pseudomonas sp. GD03651]